MSKEVLVIFKTHLDLGYTDEARKVQDNYLKVFIPNAIRVGYELKGSQTEFIWTTGSFLIWQALQTDDGTVEKAIRDGIIRWHGLPFTTHTELMNQKLFTYGLSLSEKLDKRFGKKTIASKMTDVPGHTKGIVPIMKKHGIEFLHIGVNSATPLPEVPPFFKWRCGGEEINVMYQSSYGTAARIGDDAVAFAHTGDNMGPQSAEEIVRIYEKLSEQFPGYRLRAATLEDLALKVRALPDLPVVEQEIGDTWIHGVGTDPKKTAMFRSLLRQTEGMNYDRYDLTNSLLAVPEHTWGVCLQRYFPNTTDYYEKDRRKPENKAGIEILENSWREQRHYITLAEETLGVKADYPLDLPDLDAMEMEEINPFDPGFTVSWQLFDNADYERYKKVYLVVNDRTLGYALWDFTKPGLPDYKGGIFEAVPCKYRKKGDTRYILYRFDKETAEKYGLPYLIAEITGDAFSVKWFDKKPLRLPNAFWLKVNGQKEKWQIHKLGQWIDPEEVLGSPLIAATDYGVKNDTIEIETLDAALVAPFGRRLLDFEKHPQKQDLYFNLYNNIWNTNFPFWYSDDAVFRFRIKRR